MKKFTKLLGIVLIMALVMSMGISSAFADTVPETYNVGTHTITITNTDQNVTHSYAAYRVFAGFLNNDGQGDKLGNIVWGEGVNGAALLTALQASNVDAALKATSKIIITEAVAESGTPGEEGYVAPVAEVAINVGESLFKYCETAADVAEVVSGFSSTTGANESAGAIDAFATLVAANLATKAADFTASGTSYTATVTGDGYFFVKDTTSNLVGDDGNDTLSKYLLAVVKDTTVVAKDTGVTSKKEIDNGTAKVAADSAAIGDTVTFVVTATIPNTYKYENHFVFNMNDELPAGLTFTGISSITVGGTAITDATLETTKPYAATTYDGTNGYYTLKIDGAAPATKTGGSDYAWTAEDYDAVTETGGQAITVVFNEFKKFVEKNELTGNVVVTYTAVVNDDANYTATANENEVTFTYSNNPNHDYDGDEITGTEPHGVTPESKTRTYTTAFQILKVDENSSPLAGAIFELSGTALNRTVLTGVRYEKDGYEALNGETVGTTKYWKLNDGSYTTTDPSGDGVNQSRYVTPMEEYVQVTFSTNVVDEKETTLTLESGSNGIIKFVGLNEGSYTLKEIAAPDGYNKLEGTSTVTISWSDPQATDATSPAKDQGGFTISATDFAKEATWNSTNNQFEVTIQNQSGTTLPSTGGIGTTIFYVVGSILVVAAGVLLITKKRMSREG